MKADELALVNQQLALLPVPVRLAMAYANGAYRLPLTLIFALDQRLAGIVRHSHEPMLAQLRLTWWRERLGAGEDGGTAADPLLALLRRWPGSQVPLAALAEGWEVMTGPAPLSPAAMQALADARAGAVEVLADDAAAAEPARRMMRNWALFDLATHFSDPREAAAALDLARAQDWRAARLPRGLRPLAVLHGLAAKALSMESPRLEPGPAMLLRAMRIGIVGR